MGSRTARIMKDKEQPLRLLRNRSFMESSRLAMITHSPFEPMVRFGHGAETIEVSLVMEPRMTKQILFALAMRQIGNWLPQGRITRWQLKETARFGFGARRTQEPRFI